MKIEFSGNRAAVIGYDAHGIIVTVSDLGDKTLKPVVIRLTPAEARVFATALTETAKAVK